MTEQYQHLTCQDLLGQLSDYLDGDLEAALCAELEAHLAQCPNCRILVDTVRKTITLYRSLPPTEPPPDAEERLYAVLHLQQ